MHSTALRWLGRSLVVAAGVLTAACAAESPAGPDRMPLSLSQDVDLGVCERLQPPEGSKLVTRMYARGVQIYRWTGTAWALVAPRATLYANDRTDDVIGTHYAGPTWETNSGSKVVAAALDRCTADPSAIAWLKLGAVSAEGPGLFDHVTHILRINTVAGLAPGAPGNFVDERVEIPYETEYLFYRAP